MRVLLCGSLKFIDEMRRIADELKDEGFEPILPRFSLGEDLSGKEIEELKKEVYEKRVFERVLEVESWFYEQLKKCDALLIVNPGGYIGLSTAAEIGVVHVLGKPTFFLEEPADLGLAVRQEYDLSGKLK